jgi:hypothetical protein
MARRKENLAMAEDKLNREREDFDIRENMLAEGTEALT